MAGVLPDGWAEHSDPGSGRTFFYNAGTGETAWERPQPAAAAAGALPEGWVEHLDPGSGRNFYYNAASGETSWERPQAAPAAATPGALPEGWAEHLDPGSGRSFYFHAPTQQTSWERPAAPATASALPAAASALPAGWTEHSDPGSGRVFYSKAATGETSWERPPDGPKGTWSTSQAADLGRNPQPSLHVLQQRTQVLSTAEGGMWSSVSRVIDALNDCALVVNGGLCVLYSSSKESYWLVWRSDKDKDAESVMTAPG